MRCRGGPQGDVQALLDYYAQYIGAQITFECVLPGLEAFKERIASFQAFYPYIVAEENGRILGYAYAHRHMEREACQWNAELFVYLDRTCTSLGIGTLLVTRLIQILKLQGILKVTSGITQPNEKSDGLRELHRPKRQELRATHLSPHGSSLSPRNPHRRVSPRGNSSKRNRFLFQRTTVPAVSVFV